MITVSDISNLQCADKIEIFRHIAVSGGNDLNLDVLDSIATSQNHAFLDFCEKVYRERDKINDISYDLKEHLFKIDYIK